MSARAAPVQRCSRNRVRFRFESTQLRIFCIGMQSLKRVHAGAPEQTFASWQGEWEKADCFISD